MRLLLCGLIVSSAATGWSQELQTSVTRDHPVSHQEISPQDDELLEEISYASFRFFVDEANPSTALVPDNVQNPNISSIAAQGYAFSAWVIGAERGWIAHGEAEALSLKALGTLESTDATRYGMFAHFLDTRTGQISEEGYESGASTIDSALLAAGMLTAGEYFGGEVKARADQLFADMDWAAFRDPDKNNQVRMLWNPADPHDFSAGGEFAQPTWDWYTDETLLIVLLGISAPDPGKRLDPGEAMTNWNRPVGSYGQHSYIYSWPGTLFTYTFAQCYFDFRILGEDVLGVNWWENTLSAVRANRDWCRDNAGSYTTYGPNRWGVTACSGPQFTYVVPGHQPRGPQGDDPAGGTLAPYGAGMAVLWEPADAIAALRHMKSFVVGGADVWVSVDSGGYGFRDAFNIDENWASPDILGIAQGPMLLCIENLRSELLFRTLIRNQHIRHGLKSAGFDVPCLDSWRIE